MTHLQGDSDYDIAMPACTTAMTMPVVVVGDDTDLLVLLQHHFKHTEHECIYLQTSTKLINIDVLQKSIDPDLSHSLLFIHGLSGCDTTSRPFGIGKSSVMSKYRDLHEVSNVFLCENANRTEVEAAGDRALSIIYRCSHGLNFERAAKFSDKVVSGSHYIPPERLPPTSDAARFHSQRVYLQVQAWIGNKMNPTEWGWRLHSINHVAMLKPIKMEQAAAPPSLLKIIKCNCAGKCDKKTCSCRKIAMECTLACGQCRGISCTNWVMIGSSDTTE